MRLQVTGQETSILRSDTSSRRFMRASPTLSPCFSSRWTCVRRREPVAAVVGARRSAASRWTCHRRAARHIRVYESCAGVQSRLPRQRVSSCSTRHHFRDPVGLHRRSTPPGQSRRSAHFCPSLLAVCPPTLGTSVFRRWYVRSTVHLAVLPAVSPGRRCREKRRRAARETAGAGGDHRGTSDGPDRDGWWDEYRFENTTQTSRNWPPGSINTVARKSPRAHRDRGARLVCAERQFPMTLPRVQTRWLVSVQ